jgi:transglutaminase-like putative cysteine protease
MITEDSGVDYTVTLEPNGEHWLLALDVPSRLVNGALLTRDFQLISRKEINDLFRYRMQSRLNYKIGIGESADYLALTRQYPEQINPRTIALGKSLARRHDSSEAVVEAVLDMFREQAFFYTLQPPLLGQHSVDQFLFETRRGFCEHYAGAFALIMRAAGIPARIVTGYQGGEYNRVGNYLIVRQSDAHAWTEVWIEGRGWVRIDPTAAVSPSRIEQGLDDALADESSGFRIQNRNPIFGNLLYSWDNLQHSWNDWVLNYDQRRQRDFLNRLNLGIETWSDMIFALVASLVSVTALFWFAVWYRERPPAPELYETLFRRLLKKLSKRGYDKQPAEDARAFVARLPRREFPDHAQIVRIANLYNNIKYGRRGASSRALGNLRLAINSLRL